MIANLPTWIVNISCRGGFQHRECFFSGQDAEDGAQLANQIEFVTDVEIVPPGQAGVCCRLRAFSLTRWGPGCR
jgi:hypothetical protein